MTPVQQFLAHPATAEMVTILAKAIIGPTNTGHFPVEREKLEQLREIRWNNATEQERGEALSAARSVLAEIHEQQWFV